MSEKPNLTMLIGPSLSGKSMYAAAHKDCVVVSSDAKRLELNCSEYDPALNGMVFKKCKNDIFEALSNGQNVIFDATNLSRRRRKRDIQFFKSCFPELEVTGVVFNTDKEILYSRLGNRSPDAINYVTKDVIDRQCRVFKDNFPTADEFDELHLIEAHKEKIPLDEQIDDLNRTSGENFSKTYETIESQECLERG